MSSQRMSHATGPMTEAIGIALLAVVVIAVFNPGCANEDTFDQWGQAALGEYHDWHPATLAIMWSGLRAVYDSLRSVVALQVVLFGIGALLTVRVCHSTVVRLGLLAAIAVVPPVFTYLGFVGKDTSMACFLILAIGLYYQFRDRKTPAVWILAIVALYLGYASRHNAVFAVAPILFLLCVEVWRPLTSLAATVVLLAGFAGAERALHAAHGVIDEQPQQGLLLYDLGALSRTAGEVLIPPEFQTPHTSVAALQRGIDPANASLFFGPRPLAAYRDDPVLINRLFWTWLDVVRQRPLEYLAWRADVFSAFLGLHPTMLQPFLESCDVVNPERIEPVQSLLHERVMERLISIAQSPFFRPYVYTALLLVITAGGLVARRPDLTLIAGGTLLYNGAFFILINASTFRYAVFSVFVTVLLLARLLAERLSARERKSAAPPPHRKAPELIVAGLCCLIGAGVVYAARPVIIVRIPVPNGDFEAGSAAPWMAFQDVTAEVGTAMIHGGRFALVQTSGSGSTYLDVPGLKAGQRYVVSAWVSLPEPATAARIAVWNQDTSTATFAGVQPQGNGWGIVQHTFTAGASGTVRIHLIRDAGPQAVFWDDIAISEGSVAVRP